MGLTLKFWIKIYLLEYLMKGTKLFQFLKTLAKYYGVSWKNQCKGTSIYMHFLSLLSSQLNQPTYSFPFLSTRIFLEMVFIILLHPYKLFILIRIRHSFFPWFDWLNHKINIIRYIIFCRILCSFITKKELDKKFLKKNVARHSSE